MHDAVEVELIADGVVPGDVGVVVVVVGDVDVLRVAKLFEGVGHVGGVRPGAVAVAVGAAVVRVHQ